MDDGRRREGGMDLKTRGEHAHTGDESACHPRDRSATTHTESGEGEEISILHATLVLVQFCVYMADVWCVCCSCVVLCAVRWLGFVFAG